MTERGAGRLASSATGPSETTALRPSIRQRLAELLQSRIIQTGRAILEEPVEILAGALELGGLDPQDGALETLVGGIGLDRQEKFEVVFRLLGSLLPVDFDVDEIPQHAHSNVACTRRSER